MFKLHHICRHLFVGIFIEFDMNELIANWALRDGVLTIKQ